VFVRLAKRRALNDCKSEMRKALAPIDQSFSQRGGAENIVHILRNALTAGVMVLALDVANAFNTRSIFTSLFRAKSLDRLWRVAWMTYSLPSSAFARGSDGKLSKFTSFVGVRQGDILGLLFALSFVDDLRLVESQCPGIMILSFQDNIYALGEPKACADSIPVFQKVLAANGSKIDFGGGVRLVWRQQPAPRSCQLLLLTRYAKPV
jgi:hypothetical protein